MEYEIQLNTAQVTRNTCTTVLFTWVATLGRNHKDPHKYKITPLTICYWGQNGIFQEYDSKESH